MCSRSKHTKFGLTGSAPNQPTAPSITVINHDQIDDYFGPETRETPQQRECAIKARSRHLTDRNL
jgi:hypothetical protein